MDGNFFHYSIYDRFIQRQPCACVCELFLYKTSPQKLLTGFLTKFHRTVPVKVVKNFSSLLQKKSGLWSNTGAQVPLVTAY